jgi:aryl-alcohol dehydrogenase-like predicted oxidoreductase
MSNTNEQPKIEYRRLGKSGLRVSVPILGAMSIGSSKWAPWVIEEEEVSEHTFLLIQIDAYCILYVFA